MKRRISIFLLAIVVMVTAFSMVGCNKEGTELGTAKETPKLETPKETPEASQDLYPLTFKDSYDRELTLEKEPERIISIAPNITETIYALDKQAKLVGRTEFCDYPEEVKGIASIGSLREPNIEKIVELQPDLVIASTHFQKEVLAQLEGLGIKVAVLYGAESFEGVYETIQKVGSVLNAKAKADEVITGMKEKVQTVLDKVEGKEKPSVYYVVSFGKFGDYTAGKGTFISEIIGMAGGKNAADDTEGWEYSLEKLVEKNPDIMICSMYFDSKEGILQANGYKDLTAVKEGKLYEIDNNLLDRQGPRLADGLMEMARIIHPEVFE